jgi:hypothetical protein
VFGSANSIVVRTRILLYSISESPFQRGPGASDEVSSFIGDSSSNGGFGVSCSIGVMILDSQTIYCL